MASETLNIRRLVLDVDKAVSRPSVVELAEAICQSPGVAAVNITVTEIDIETVGFNVTIEGEWINYPALVEAIEKSGAAVHSLDQMVAGERVVEDIKRGRR